MSYGVREFGARGDGTTLDHGAIQSAIDRCASEGGGTVRLPAGRYLCGTIRLKSNVRLYLDSGARIEGSGDPSLYPVIAPTPHGNLPGQIQALLWVEQAENASVAGPGTIDGGGSEELRGAAAANTRFRPVLVMCRGCRNLRFTEVTLANSCFWTLHLQRCVDVSVRGVNIFANPRRINTDGIDPDGCQNVIISDCIISTGDDCIVVKSTEGDPCENIVVSNCILTTSCAAMKIGTEAIGPIRNVTFSNCQVRGAQVAMALYMKDGSVYERIVFSNIVAEAAGDFPIIVDSTPRYYDDPKYGTIRNVLFQNVMLRGGGRCYIQGTPGHPVESLAFENVTWDLTEAFRKRASRPTGAARVRLDPARENHAERPFQFIILGASALRMRGVQVREVIEGAAAGRGLLWMREIMSGRVEIDGGTAVREVVTEDCDELVFG